MATHIRFALAAGGALALAGCGGGGPEAADTSSPAPAVAAAAPEAAAPAGPAAPAAFAQCRACHAVVPGRHGVGPSLAGVYGTKAGEIAGYAFSAAMKSSGLVWDDATLDRYLAAPMKVVPGTRMVYAGQADPAKRAELIAYIKSLK